jgi:hypothetical protein
MKDESTNESDPSVPMNRRGLSSKVIMDCARKMTPEFPPRSEWDGKRYPQKAIPSKETKQHVKDPGQNTKSTTRHTGRATCQNW